MRFGCYVRNLDEVQHVQDAGYDYFEMEFRNLMPTEDNERFEEVRRRIRAFGIKPEACNYFIPPKLKIVGHDVDYGCLTSYVKIGMRRAAELGCKVVVFGSGDARSVPEGFPREKAFDQLVKFLSWVGEEARFNNMVVAIEALNRRECNIINSIGEALELAKVVGRPEVQVLVDLYHIVMEGESLDIILAAGPYIRHVHIAEPYGRRVPGSGTYNYVDFIAALKRIMYDFRVSIECSFSDVRNECRQGLNFLKQIFSL